MQQNVKTRIFVLRSRPIITDSSAGIKQVGCGVFEFSYEIQAWEFYADIRWKALQSRESHSSIGSYAYCLSVSVHVFIPVIQHST